jgi:hypothetical protein
MYFQTLFVNTFLFSKSLLTEMTFQRPRAGQMCWIQSYITALIMGTEMVPETSAIFNQLTRLIVREDFINVNHRENFGSYLRFLTDFQVL